MNSQLVFVHGREQQNKNPDDLKKEWIDTLKLGLEKCGLQLPIPESDIHFPFYGDTLDALNQGVPPQQAAKIVVKGNGSDDDPEALFVRDVLIETARQMGITDQQIQAEAQPLIDRGAVVEKGVLNWGWVQSILEALDTHVPGASSASVALATRDVHRYLTNPVIRRIIDDGVSSAITPKVKTVVVAHSLGSVVAYNVLKERGHRNDWKVPQFVTVGSPLAVNAIKQAITPRKHPDCVGHWFNAMDPRDVVALYPLDKDHFAVNPPIENKTDVDNHTKNRHGITGYLSDPAVARRIYDAL